MAAKAGQAREETDYDLVVKDFMGVNTQAARTAIQETEFAWLENVMPIGYANLRAVPYQGSPVATIPAVSINLMKYVNINNTDYKICFTAGGSAHAVNLSSYAVTLIAAGGTFVGTVDCAQWKNERIIIVASNGYWSWDGTTLVSNNSVNAINVTAAGINFTSVPALTFAGGGGTGLAANVSAMNAISAVIAAGGTGYSIGDVLICSGGTQTTTAKFQVATLGGGGAVATVTVLQSGSYTVLPANPASTTGGLGTSCTLTISWGVLSVAVTATGSGYISPPAIGFTGGGGSAFTAVATLMVGPSAGSTVSTFSGRVWVGNARTESFSAPNSYTDFTTANSGGSFIITDETLVSNIFATITANNFLYIFGSSSINVISDVRIGTGSPAPTLFSNTNISAQIGSVLPSSIFVFGRIIAFATPYGFYALSGTTPQKISDNLDGIMPLIDFTKPISGGIANIYSILCIAFSFTYKDPAGTRPLLAIFFGKKWFFASQGSGISFIAPAFQSSVPTLFGTDGTNIWKLFSDTTSNISTKIATALWPLKGATRMKETQKAGVEITTAAISTAVTLNLDSDFGSIPVNISSSNTGQWINAAMTVGNWINAASTQGGWLTSGFLIYQGDSEMKGRYVGYTMTSSAPQYAINGFLMQYQMSTNWATKAS
jgi:hypothetical protein